MTRRWHWIGPLLLLIGVFLWSLLGLALDLRDWLDSDTWLSTPSSQLEIHSRSSRVRYQYTVDGQIYRSERTHFFMGAPYRSERHLGWLRRHRRAEEVAVYYDPDWPSRAVLVPTVERGVWSGMALTVFWVALLVLGPLLFFGGLWWWLWRQFRA